MEDSDVLADVDEGLRHQGDVLPPTDYDAQSDRRDEHSHGHASQQAEHIEGRDAKGVNIEFDGCCEKCTRQQKKGRRGGRPCRCTKPLANQIPVFEEFGCFACGCRGCNPSDPGPSKNQAAFDAELKRYKETGISLAEKKRDGDAKPAASPSNEQNGDGNLSNKNQKKVQKDRERKDISNPAGSGPSQYGGVPHRGDGRDRAGDRPHDRRDDRDMRDFSRRDDRDYDRAPERYDDRGRYRDDRGEPYAPPPMGPYGYYPPPPHGYPHYGPPQGMDRRGYPGAPPPGAYPGAPPPGYDPRYPPPHMGYGSYPGYPPAYEMDRDRDRERERPRARSRSRERLPVGAGAPPSAAYAPPPREYDRRPEEFDRHERRGDDTDRRRDALPPAPAAAPDARRDSKVCKDYCRGKCKFSDCKFVHPLPDMVADLRKTWGWDH